MKRDRFLIREIELQAGMEITFDADESYHIAEVLRKRPGDRVTVFNNTAREYIAEITGVRNGIVSARVVSGSDADSEYPFKITAAVSFPKGKRADYMVQKLVEIGVDGITPLETVHSVVHVEKGSEKFTHFERIVLESVKQSGRVSIPRINAPLSLRDIVGNSSGYQLKIIATGRGEKRTLKEILRGIAEEQIKTGFKVIFLTGPEGGFAPEEIEAAVNAGFMPVSLGRTILRAETAAVAAAAGLVYEWI
ncbi:MAG: 16S rRNA (uracil(1498)-N(3))-methyltransferase [Planctomycetes bacterium]|nr:16S rRNA (uracil(1498)-N(3))-methyltransferase [Planctomycetota bacterium]